MKRKISLSLKITLMIVSISAIVIFLFTYLNIQSQQDYFQDNYTEKAIALAQSFDASIQVHNEMNNTVLLQQYIENTTASNQELHQLNINVPQLETGVFTIVASNNRSLLGEPSSVYHEEAYRKSRLDHEAATLFFMSQENIHRFITVITPINLSGEFVGTYEIVLSMDRAYAVFETQMNFLIFLSVLSFFGLVFAFLILLRRSLVKPIIVFRDTSRVVGEGNLDVKVDIRTRDELGELASAFNTMTVDLKESREKISRYTKTLEKLLSQKDEFIHQLGHDLKNPLTPLVGLIPLIIEHEKDPKLKEHLLIIHKNVEYMRDLIFETLQLAKLRSSKIEFDFQPLHLKDEIQSVLVTQQFLLTEAHMKVTVDVSPDIIVRADRLRLAEVFKNLLTNAVKYTPGGNGTIVIAAASDTTKVTVSVADSGIGMSKEETKLIFDEFYKADKSTDDFHSSGLGLSITKRIVELHGGTIWVQSLGKGKGSTFFFTLSIAK